MSGVLGISGVFLMADDPAALRDWYARHLGLALMEWTPGRCYGLNFEHQLPDGRASHTVFSIQKAPQPLGEGPRSCTVNWRVEDLDAFLAGLDGVPVDKREDGEYGRFAWITDPEGNRLELYQLPPEE